MSQCITYARGTTLLRNRMSQVLIISCFTGVLLVLSNSTNSKLRHCFNESEYSYIDSCFPEDASTSGTVTFASGQYCKIWYTLQEAEIWGERSCRSKRPLVSTRWRYCPYDTVKRGSCTQHVSVKRSISLWQHPFHRKGHPTFLSTRPEKQTYVTRPHNTLELKHPMLQKLN
jgi:hypothetical protein